MPSLPSVSQSARAEVDMVVFFQDDKATKRLTTQELLP